MKTKYGLRIVKSGDHTFGPNVWLADETRQTWDGSWYTNQDRHPEEKVKTWKRSSSAARRGVELARNGVKCEIAAIEVEASLRFRSEYTGGAQ